MTVYTFILRGVDPTPIEGQPHHYVLPTLKAEASSWEEATEKIQGQIPAGATAEPHSTDTRLSDEEVLSDEYLALIAERKAAGETDAQARILNR